MRAGSKRLRDLLAVLALAAAALFASAVLSAAELERAYLEAKGELPD